MSKYADIDKLKELLYTKPYVINKYGDLITSVDEMNCCLESATADVTEVKHGKWTEKFHGDASDLFVYTHVCSACGESSMTGYQGDYLDYHYCPKCGARMDGAE